ncbi:MAG: hypothetical protein KKB21_04000, partial [Nanoarchaeota archaeon]|nr:hypothetical protein [Nanoarchaeota archaeon]
ISDSIMNNNDNGIELYWANNTQLINVTANSNKYYGIGFMSSFNTLVSNSRACGTDSNRNDIICVGYNSIGNSGTGNKFTNVQACSDNNWPSLSDYSGC